MPSVPNRISLFTAAALCLALLWLFVALCDFAITVNIWIFAIFATLLALSTAWLWSCISPGGIKATKSKAAVALLALLPTLLIAVFPVTSRRVFFANSERITLGSKFSESASLLKDFKVATYKDYEDFMCGRESQVKSTAFSQVRNRQDGVFLFMSDSNLEDTCFVLVSHGIVVARTVNTD